MSHPNPHPKPDRSPHDPTYRERSDPHTPKKIPRIQLAYSLPGNQPRARNSGNDGDDNDNDGPGDHPRPESTRTTSVVSNAQVRPMPRRSPPDTSFRLKSDYFRPKKIPQIRLPPDMTWREDQLQKQPKKNPQIHLGYTRTHGGTQGPNNDTDAHDNNDDHQQPPRRSMPYLLPSGLEMNEQIAQVPLLDHRENGEAASITLAAPAPTQDVSLKRKAVPDNTDVDDRDTGAGMESSSAKRRRVSSKSEVVAARKSQRKQ